MQIVMGVLCIIFGITLAALDYSSYLSSTSEIGVIGYGIWIGLYVSSLILYYTAYTRVGFNFYKVYRLYK